MIAQAEHEHVAPEGRPVLLADHEHHVLARERVRAAAGHEKLIVENAVVLVGDLLEHDVLVFGRGHHHQVLERVVQVSAVVHVHVRGAAVPSLRRHVGHPLQRRFATVVTSSRGDLDLHRLREHLEALYGRQLRLSRPAARRGTRRWNETACRPPRSRARTRRPARRTFRRTP